jgi:hypothetical protein
MACFICELIPGPSNRCAAEEKTGTEEKISSPVLRNQAFFGLHFDLHASADDIGLGADATEENIRQLIKTVRPDFIQHDCKGHGGLTSCPVRVGWAAPGIVKDELAMWRKVTREEGVTLGLHYSGVWDAKVLAEHPDWGALDAAGKQIEISTSTFGPYVDQLMVPQLLDIVTRYDIDALWIDGDCWGARLDWSPPARTAWSAKMGGQKAPIKSTDTGWEAWKDFHRDQFEQYLGHWIDALHKAKPGLQVASNWMYSTFAPKPPRCKVDFISGDYPAFRSVEEARCEARYLSNVGKPWDLMAWGFDPTRSKSSGFKPAVQLEQEIMEAVMHGGGISIYYQPTRTGYISESIRATAADVARFCRERKAFCFHSISIPEVAVLYSWQTQKQRSNNVFAPGDNPMCEVRGVMDLLLENHYSVDLLAEWNLTPRLNEFPLVVIPEASQMDEATRHALLRYAEQGGNLLLIGAATTMLFADQLGVSFVGKPTECSAYLATRGKQVSRVVGAWHEVKPLTAQTIAWRIQNPNSITDADFRDTGLSTQALTVNPRLVAASIVPHGKGKIAAIYGPLCKAYFENHHPDLRQWFAESLQPLYPEAKVEISGPAASAVEIALRRTAQGQIVLNLLNTANTPCDERHAYIDFIPPIGPLQVKLRGLKSPRTIRWMPVGEQIAFENREGVINLTVPRLEIHGALLFE